MTGHTPGPWTVRLAGSQSQTVREIAQRSSAEIRFPITIARIISGTKDDARLIASAPDLLSALEHLINDVINHQDGDDRSMTLDVTVARAEEVIAKARGQS